jgi:hypothetical protein
MSFTTTPPAVVDYNTPATPTGTAPGHSTPAALSNSAPDHTTPSALTSTPPDRLFPDAFVELSSGGRSLKARTVLAADAGAVFQGTVAGVLKNYQVNAGTDPESLPNIVHPANYDAGTNAFVFTLLN